MKKRIVVGLSGASGLPVAKRILEALRSHPDYESHLIISDSAAQTMQAEGEMDRQGYEALADVYYVFHDIGAAVASGTFRSEGMIIVPCSMKTVAGIACGYTDNLLLRAADVALKERRKLVLMIRECPLHAIHLKNMKTLSEMGADILPLVMTFYTKPKTIDDMVRQMAGKALERFGIYNEDLKRWKDDD